VSVDETKRRAKGKKPSTTPEQPDAPNAIAGFLDGLAALAPSCREAFEQSAELQRVREILDRLDPSRLSRRAPGKDGAEQPLCAKLAEALLAVRGESERRLAEAVHELKTPLAIIAGYLDLLASGKAGSLNDRQREILEESKGSCGRLQKFVQDFLTYSSLEPGKVVLDIEVRDLNACLTELFGYWFSEFQRKGVALYFPINTELASFEFDCAKIQQVVSNLLQNSLKFTPQGGAVWLSAEPHQWERRGTRREIRKERRKHRVHVPNAVCVTVADTGPGILPEYQQEIFSDYKLPAPGQPMRGTGLGLAIARRLVQAHGGRIWVHHEVEAGSKISFVLPLHGGGTE
jgi:signal transduction histidine kinase